MSLLNEVERSTESISGFPSRGQLPGRGNTTSPRFLIMSGEPVVRAKVTEVRLLMRRCPRSVRATAALATEVRMPLRDEASHRDCLTGTEQSAESAMSSAVGNAIRVVIA